MPELVDVTPGSSEWLAARRSGVTATDIVTITGLTTTDSAYALYWRKLGIIPEPGDNDRWRLGRDLEPIIATRWCDANGYALMRGGLWRSVERPWQMATLDRRVTNWPAEDDTAEASLPPLELKSWADADRARWDDGPPLSVRAQVLWQMDVMGVATGHVGVLFLPSGEFRSYTVEHDNSHKGDTCQACADIDALRIAGAGFMTTLTDETLGPPSPDGSAATLAALKARYNDPRNDKTAPIPLDLWNPWYGACEEHARWEKIKKAYEAQIREVIGDAGVIEVDGHAVARRTISVIKAHHRKESTRDAITRIKQKADDDA